ncbi:MAG: response regulator [Proteobacteria bacterium]|nr:response regulator [Pseudomonadota bacterium]
MNKKVLIVDDEPHIRLLLEQTLDELEEVGVEILMAADGREALEMVSEERPDLILLDVMMPHVNGFDVCRTIRADPELKGIYIMMLTAKGQEFDRATGTDVGVDLYVTKPFDPDDVLSRSAEVLGIEL